MTINISSLGGGGSGVKLAPDLNYIQDSTLESSGVPTPIRGISPVDITSLTTLLSLTGKYEISILTLNGILNGTAITVKLTIDGVVIWNSTKSSVGGTTANLIGSVSNATVNPIQCESSFLLEAQQAGETDASVSYAVRPIL